MSIKLFEQAKYTRGAHYGRDRGPRDVLVAAVEFLSQLDLYLIFSTAVLTVIGLLMVYSATRNLIPTEPSYYIKRQIVYAVIGFIAMCFFVVVDYRLLQRFTNLLYVLVVLSLLAVRAIGHASGFGNAAGSGGSIREIALGPIAIQPSEFAVLVVILAIAKVVDEHHGPYTRHDIVKMVSIAGLPMALVLIQPDLGTTIIIAVVLFTLLTVAGVRARYLFAGLALAVAMFFLFTSAHILHSYQLSRLTGYLNQNCNLVQNYNLCISKTAIGAGGLRGTGLFQGAFTNNQYVPVQYADFIFSAIGEQLGFSGSIAVLMVFGVLAFRIFRAISRSADRFGQLICAGILAFLVFSVFQNVGMTVGLMPITGIPLPFISYGGSALFAFFIAIGLVVNVERNAPGRR
ncbi:MAG TPA: FtsW/RodA/SpoVE family cell cycle protein [Acidimicrobiales bacterium]|nr:FtsW/RodA/SpoVE family cell cycle protein [Acidimicrobiales bacterium]